MVKDNVPSIPQPQLTDVLTGIQAELIGKKLRHFALGGRERKTTIGELPRKRAQTEMNLSVRRSGAPM